MERNSTELPDFGDDPQRCCCRFAGTERQLHSQGISMFAMHYYSPWLGILVPSVTLEKLRCDTSPRHQSHLRPRPGTVSFGRSNDATAS